MSDRATIVARLAPAVLVVALGAAWQLPVGDWLRLPEGGAPAAARMTTALDALPGDPTVLVGFDPDLGTYAEVRPTVRGMLADLLARGARLAFVSVTSEGRALAAAELARLQRGEANAARVIDLGFVTGAEAGLVTLTRAIRPPSTESVLARSLAADGMNAVDAILVVGGNDLGPRSWVEQVLPRALDLPVLAVTPTVLLPEVQPYLAAGQLTAALTTPREGAAYRESLDLGNLARLADPSEPRPLPILVGTLAAAAVLGQALGSRLSGALRAGHAREGA